MSHSAIPYSVNSLMKNLALQNFGATKAPPIMMDRTHLSGGGGGGGGGYHHHHSGGGGHGSSKKHNIALTALTLLSFLFFLNILQNCLQEHMDSMTPQAQIVIMQARQKEAREAEAQKRKGEVHLAKNITSTSKESRQQQTLVSRVQPGTTSSNQMSHIAVKLKTIDKGRN